MARGFRREEFEPQVVSRDSFVRCRLPQSSRMPPGRGDIVETAGDNLSTTDVLLMQHICCNIPLCDQPGIQTVASEGRLHVRARPWRPFDRPARDADVRSSHAWETERAGHWAGEQHQEESRPQVVSAGGMNNGIWAHA